MFIKFLLYVAIVYLSAIALSQWVSNSMIFLAPPSSYKDTDNIIKIKTQTGDTISAVYLKNPEAKFTLFYHHGNAVDLGGLMFLFKEYKKLGVSVFAYDYPGYGTSTGKPNERTTHIAAQAAFDYLVKELKVPENHIIAYGSSLGSAFATRLATKHKLAGLILEAPFVSAFRVLTHYKLLPWDKFVILDDIPHIKSPVLVIHGKKDKIVPFWHGQAIFQAAPSPKSHYWVEDADHNDLIFTAGDAYFEAIKKFIQTLN